ncbi:hypothetical protein DOTSEDRAFT_31978 [Dothistroma septosporum NZE10]|uniref:N-acetyltransferase domain-containing protein n=1 Tax=Dothistroma septosporum (strain NZE10 / CBS 128990) TaxID=675120 RepID=N1PYS9_DOTSN|nr:hypothetical protein DOTSEDRAFT_31978 [Dothistroma septosporum NZE10]
MSQAQNSPDLGKAVDATPCAIPDNSTALTGQFVTLEGVDRSHLQSLHQNLDLPNNSDLFNYLPWTVPGTAEDLWNILTDLEGERGFVVYAIKASLEHLNHQEKTHGSRPKHNDIVGIICYLEIHHQHRDIEIGGILFSPALQRTAAATEAHYLMLKNVLEPNSSALSKGTAPPYRRVTWKCNALNKPSQRAAERLGYKYEGTFRKHLIVKGRNRDTTWLSLLDDEWLAAKEALEKWLAESNFDWKGDQKQGLVDIRASIELH